MEKWVAVIDLKAYYATFECVERGLDPFTTPLAVTDTERKGATIVLSVSPYLKSSIKKERFTSKYSWNDLCKTTNGKIRQKKRRDCLYLFRFCW